MTKKILFCATVDYHFEAFHLPYMKWFKEQGWEVDVAANGTKELPWVDRKYNLPFHRSPLQRDNLAAYQRLKTIIKANNYQIIHCHTPVGGVIGRLAAKEARKQGTKVLYTAHGFHFCKGAPLINWLAYYPIEKSMAHLTDCLITINEEDYQLAAKRLRVNRIEHVHGVGIDTEKFLPLPNGEKMERKKSFGYQPSDFLLFYAAEFNENKNQKFLLHVMARLKERIPSIRLVLAGEGPLLNDCKELAEDLGIRESVDFLGYRTDLQKLVPLCDIAVASSLREGLPVNIMEAMACGLPVIAIDNRGHRELVKNGSNGWIVTKTDLDQFVSKLEDLITKPEWKERFGENGRKEIAETYSTSRILVELGHVYQSYMEKEGEKEWAVQ